MRISHWLRNNITVPNALMVGLILFGGMKVWGMEKFLDEAKKIWIVPEVIQGYLPVIVPLTEFFLASLIFLPAARKTGLRLSCGLLMLYVAYHVWNIWAGFPASCSCLGADAFSGVSKEVAAICMIVMNAATLYLVRCWFQDNQHNSTPLGAEKGTLCTEENKGLPSSSCLS